MSREALTVTSLLYQPYRWLRNLWWARQRKIDLMILWPICKEKARDMDHAKAAFAVHAFEDPCWIEYYGHDRLVQIIDGME